MRICKILGNRNYSTELNRHNASSSIPSEYTITKKLVLISSSFFYIAHFTQSTEVFIDNDALKSQNGLHDLSPPRSLTLLTVTQWN